MKDANWLKPWMNEVIVHANGAPLLELGCGQGSDTRVLASCGLSAVSVDLNRTALAQCRDIEGGLRVNADISAALPFADDAFSFVLASLSLHYFSRQETRSIMTEIRRVLTDDGALLLRVNSIKDVNFGAGQGEELEENYFLNHGRKKRFFDQRDVEAMLQDMTVRELWHESIDRYGKEKCVWVAHAAM